MAMLAAALAAPGSAAKPAAKAAGPKNCPEIIKSGTDTRGVLACLIEAQPARARETLAERFREFAFNPHPGGARYAAPALLGADGKAKAEAANAVKAWTSRTSTQTLADLYIVVAWKLAFPAWASESAHLKKVWKNPSVEMKKRLEGELAPRWKNGRIAAAKDVAVFLDDAAKRASAILDGGAHPKKPELPKAGAPPSTPVLGAEAQKWVELARRLAGANWGYAPSDVHLDGAVAGKVWAPGDKAGYRWLAVKKVVRDGRLEYGVADVTDLKEFADKPWLRKPLEPPTFFSDKPGETKFEFSGRKYVAVVGADGSVVIRRDAGEGAKSADPSGRGVLKTTFKDADARWEEGVKRRGLVFMDGKLHYVAPQPGGTLLFVPEDGVSAKTFDAFGSVDASGMTHNGEFRLIKRGAGAPGRPEGSPYTLACRKNDGKYACEVVPGKPADFVPPPAARETGGRRGRGTAGGRDGEPNAPNAPNAPDETDAEDEPEEDSRAPGGRRRSGRGSRGDALAAGKPVKTGDADLDRVVNSFLGADESGYTRDEPAANAGSSASLKKKIRIVGRGGDEASILVINPKIANSDEAILSWEGSKMRGFGDYLVVIHLDPEQVDYYLFSAKNADQRLRRLYRRKRFDSHPAGIYVAAPGNPRSKVMRVYDVEVAADILGRYEGMSAADVETVRRRVTEKVKDAAPGQYTISGNAEQLFLSYQGGSSQIWPRAGKTSPGASKADKKIKKGEVGADPAGAPLESGELPAELTLAGQHTAGLRHSNPSKTTGLYKQSDGANAKWYVVFKAKFGDGAAATFSGYKPLGVPEGWPPQPLGQKVRLLDLSATRLPASDSGEREMTVLLVPGSDKDRGLFCVYRGKEQKFLLNPSNRRLAEAESNSAGAVLSWGLKADAMDQACKNFKLP